MPSAKGQRSQLLREPSNHDNQQCLRREAVGVHDLTKPSMHCLLQDVQSAHSIQKLSFGRNIGRKLRGNRLTEDHRETGRYSGRGDLFKRATYKAGRRHRGHSKWGDGVSPTPDSSGQSKHRRRRRSPPAGSSPCRRCCRGNDCAAPRNVSSSEAVCIDQSQYIACTTYWPSSTSSTQSQQRVHFPNYISTRNLLFTNKKTGLQSHYLRSH